MPVAFDRAVALGQLVSLPGQDADMVSIAGRQNCRPRLIGRGHSASSSGDSIRGTSLQFSPNLWRTWPAAAQPEHMTAERRIICYAPRFA
jgi:hypothetical protein